MMPVNPPAAPLAPSPGFSPDSSSRSWMNAMVVLLALALMVAVGTFIYFAGQLTENVQPGSTGRVPVNGAPPVEQQGVVGGPPAFHHRTVIEATPSAPQPDATTRRPAVPVDHSPVPLLPLPPGASAPI